MRTSRTCLFLAMILCPVIPAQAGGIGVLGDSYSDEYQFYPPHRSTARSWVEILAATRGLNFGEFRKTSWGEPRNQGFAYNWARSGATSADMIASGQHTGLAAQAARGEVSIAVIFVGGNDFIDAVWSPEPRASLKGRGRIAAENVRVAVQTLLSASPGIKLLVATVPDIRDLPEFRQALRAGKLDPSLADLATSEMNVFNAEIRRMALSSGRLVVFDLARITHLAQMLSPQYVSFAGKMVERDQPGNSLDRLFLADVRHLGTLGQGLLAKLLVNVLNARCEAGIRPLDEREILAYAESLASPVVETTSFSAEPTQADAGRASK